MRWEGEGKIIWNTDCAKVLCVTKLRERVAYFSKALDIKFWIISRNPQEVSLYALLEHAKAAKGLPCESDRKLAEEVPDKMY